MSDHSAAANHPTLSVLDSNNAVDSLVDIQTLANFPNNSHTDHVWMSPEEKEQGLAQTRSLRQHLTLQPRQQHDRATSFEGISVPEDPVTLEPSVLATTTLPRNIPTLHSTAIRHSAQLPDQVHAYVDDLSLTWTRSDVDAAIAFLAWTAVHTRPDIAFAVAACARLVSDPTTQRSAAVDRILRYLCGAQRCMLVSKDNLDETGAHCGRKFRLVTLGYSTILDCGSHIKSVDAVSALSPSPREPIRRFWRSRLQKLVTLSTCEAELVTLC